MFLQVSFPVVTLTVLQESLAQKIFGVGIVALEFQDVLDVRPAPAVDRLIRITCGANVPPPPPV